MEGILWLVVNLDCIKRKRLEDRYLKAVNAFGNAVNYPHAGKLSSRQLVKERSAACEAALTALMDHLTNHGCGPARKQDLTGNHP